MLDKEQAKTKLKEIVGQFASANMNKDYINSQKNELLFRFIAYNAEKLVKLETVLFTFY